MATFGEIRAALPGHGVVGRVEILPRGHTRVGTELAYLDGSGIDVFVEAAAAPAGGLTLTDFGQSLSLLDEYMIDVRSVDDLLAEATQGTEVRRRDDQFVLAVGSLSDLPQAVIELSQVCLRVSCIAFTRPRHGVEARPPGR